MVNPLNPETPPGTRSRPHVGKHIGKAPILFAILFAFLLLGGIIFGAVNRMNRSDAVSEPPEVSQAVQEIVPAQPFVITDADDDSSIVLEEDDNAKSKPTISATGSVQNQGSQDAIIEFRNRQKLEELQARAAGQQSISKVSFDPVNDVVQPTPRDDNNTSTKRSLETTDPLLRQQALLNALSSRAGIGANDQNNQSEKISFAEKERPPEGYLLNPVTAPLSPYELKTGSVIPGLLLTALNSDLPGAVLGQVRTNVYDSASGQHLLIPQGSRLIGQYDSKISYGQNRALVVWTRLIFPDGAALNLSNMAGVTQSGESGFKDKLNKHYGRLFGSILGLSVFQAIPEIIKADATPSASSSELEKITAANISKTGEKMIEKNLAIQPTIRIRAGYRFNILVNKDILFPGAYGG